MEKKKRKKNNKAMALYGILAFVIPNIFLINMYNQEFGVIALYSLGILAGILGVVSIAMVWLLGLLTGKKEYSLIVAVVFWIIFWLHNDIYRITAQIGITSKYLFPVYVVILLILAFLFRILKENDYMKVLIPVIIAIVALMNVITFSAKLISYELHHIPYTYAANTVAVEEELPSPNIYWIHCDGMLSFQAVEQYFGYSDSELFDFMKTEGFHVTEDAWMEAGHTTMKAIPTLTCPHYYDSTLRPYMDNTQNLYLLGEAEPKNVITSTQLIDSRIENELFEAMELKGYQTNVIANRDSFFCFYPDNFYALNGPQSNEIELQHIRAEYSTFWYHLNVDFRRILFMETILTSLYSMQNSENPIAYADTMDSYFYHGNVELLMKTKTAFDCVLEQSSNQPQFTFISLMTAHAPFTYDEEGNVVYIPSGDSNETGSMDTYVPSWIYTGNLVEEMVTKIKDMDPNAVIVVQGDHGCHVFSADDIRDFVGTDQDEDVLNVWNSVMSAVYIPEQYLTGEEEVLNNPVNISRYLMNHYVGGSYEYVVE